MIATQGLADLLREPSYLRVWMVGVFSGIARWLELLVVGVYAFDTTGSPFLVALLVILRLLPLAVLGSVVGTFADRAPPRLLLLVTMAAAMMVSTAVFLVFLVGLDRYWIVAASSFVSGVVWTTDMPLRRRLLGDIAGLERIAPAMSLDSATNNATRMLGPLVGGVLFQWLGASGAFALSATMYALCVILMLGLPASVGIGAGKRAATRILRDFQEVFSFIARDRDIMRILLVTIVFNVWGFPFISMIPVVGREVLEISAGWIGFLAALEGAGAFAGALIIALGFRGGGYRRLYYFGMLGYLIFAFLTGWMVWAAPMGVALFLVGLMASGFSTMQSTLIYSVAPPEMRGRLFGVLVICIGSGLIGFANIGLMGELFGGSAAIRIVAAEGLIPLILIGVGWRQLWARDSG
jgi:MFS family permease